ELAPLHLDDPKPKDHAESSRSKPCIAAKATCLCPVWVRSGQSQNSKCCPLYPRKRQTEMRPAFLVLAEDTVRTLAPSLPEIGPVPWKDAVNCFHRCAEIESQQEASARSLLENGDSSGEGLNLDVEAIRSLREHSVSPEKRPEPVDTAANR